LVGPTPLSNTMNQEVFMFSEDHSQFKASCKLFCFYNFFRTILYV